MNKCVYITNETESLQYKSEEHIIPAGLGGIQKLPKGYVSDKANNLFSKYELIVMRHSLLTGNRLRHGPGTRGNQNVNRQKKHNIRLLREETSEPNQFLLGYVFAGKSYIIPQVQCELGLITNSMRVNTVADNYEIDNSAIHLLQFKKLLNAFLLDKNRKYDIVTDVFKESKNSINIGLHKGKWYISTNIPAFDMNVIASKILHYTFEELKSQGKRRLSKSVEDKGQVKLRHSEQIDITNNSFGFIFAKTAFNALTYLKGQEFMLQSIFDNLRKDIVECNSMSKYIISNSIHEEIFSEYVTNIPKNAHCAYIVSKDNTIYAYVSMYNEWHAHMIMTEEYSGAHFSVGFVCDWKNKNEYAIK